MKVKIMVELPDGVRHYIGRQLPPEHVTRQGWAVKRAAAHFLESFVQARVTDLSTSSWVVPPRLSDTEQNDYSAAIGYLRAQGKSPTEIAGWVLMQAARYRFPSHTLRNNTDVISQPEYPPAGDA